MLKGREASLRQLAARVGLTRALDLKVIEYFDFYPTSAGFKGMKDRIEFGLGPNEDYLYSLFHILQQTDGEGLAPLVRARLETDQPVSNAGLVRTLLDDLRSGRPIDGRLSHGHYNVTYANFTRADIEGALAAQAAAPPKTVPA
jgi:hypothetical protein